MQSSHNVESLTEIADYFSDFQSLQMPEQAYAVDNLKIWAVTGLLHVVALHQGRIALHDQECTDPELACTAISKRDLLNSAAMYRQLGTFGLVDKRSADDVQVRLNLHLAHVFAHQLRFELSEAEWTHEILPLYQKRLSDCALKHPGIPPNSSQPELLPKTQNEERCFISANARKNPTEYWCEAVAAFSTKAGRKALREVDPSMFNVLLKLVAQPERLLMTQSAKELEEFQRTMNLEQLVKDIAAL